MDKGPCRSSNACKRDGEAAGAGDRASARSRKRYTDMGRDEKRRRWLEDRANRKGVRGGGSRQRRDEARRIARVMEAGTERATQAAWTAERLAVQVHELQNEVRIVQTRAN